MTASSTVSSEQVAMDEYDRAVRAVAAAAAECGRQMGKDDDLIVDALTIMRGVIRVRLLEQNGDDTAELACLGDGIAEIACLVIAIRVLSRDGAVVAGFNEALEASGLPWRLVKPD